MKVETYEVISVDEQNGTIINEAVSEEAMALIESLDLGGQRALLSITSAGDETVTLRTPYRQMTAEERAVFSAILPQRVALEKYDAGPIPLRTLQVAAHAKDLFEQLVVWCPENASDPDPLLVGLKGVQSWSRTVGRETFILARWGEILEPLDALRDKARSILLAKANAEIAEAEATISSFKASVAARLDAYLRTGRGNGASVAISFG